MYDTMTYATRTKNISYNDQAISGLPNPYGVSMDEHGISKVVSLKV